MENSKGRTGRPAPDNTAAGGWRPPAPRLVRVPPAVGTTNSVPAAGVPSAPSPWHCSAVPAASTAPKKRRPATGGAPSTSSAGTTAARPRPAKNPPARHAGAAFDAAAAVRGLRLADPVMARLIDEVGPCLLEVNETRSVFAALSHAIVYQQLTGKAAATIHGRVCALFPRAKDGFTPRHILGADEDLLRSAGLSRAKAAALKDLAQKTASREIPDLAEVHAMDDDEIVEKLSAVRGIGRWTVEMLLIFRLGRPDVLPADDYGVRKGFAAAYRRRELPSRQQLEKHGEKWAPWRTAASWYLWRAADSAARRQAKK